MRNALVERALRGEATEQVVRWVATHGAKRAKREA